MIFDVSPEVMHMQSPKMRPEFLQPFWTLVAEVLFAKDDHTALGYVKGQFVLLLVIQSAQLGIEDLCADVGSHVFDRSKCSEERFLLRICTTRGVNMVKRCKWWIRSSRVVREKMFPFVLPR